MLEVYNVATMPGRKLTHACKLLRANEIRRSAHKVRKNFRIFAFQTSRFSQRLYLQYGGVVFIISSMTSMRVKICRFRSNFGLAKHRQVQPSPLSFRYRVEAASCWGHALSPASPFPLFIHGNDSETSWRLRRRPAARHLGVLPLKLCT